MLDLGLKFDEFRQISIDLQMKENTPVDILFIEDARKSAEGEDYTKASQQYERWTKSNHSLRYADELLATYEKLNDGSAKIFVDNFVDWVRENEITDDFDCFVNSTLIAKLLDKASPYYSPLHAIRILQSQEFSTPEGNYLLGCIYLNNEYGVKNHKLALKYLKLAAKEDIGEA